MRRCTGPVSCLPFGVVEEPNGLYRGGEAYLSNAPSHPAGNASFIHSFILPEYVQVYACKMYYMTMYYTDPLGGHPRLIDFLGPPVRGLTSNKEG